MDAIRNIRNLYWAMEWADAKIWTTVFQLHNSADEILRKRLHHLHMVQHAFLNAWRKVPHTVNAGSDLDISGLARWARQFHRDVLPVLESLKQETMEDPVELPWAQYMASKFGRQPEITTLLETLHQVLLHSTYHKGQVTVRIRELGGDPPLSDFIVWLWLGKPAPEWPL